VTLEFIPNWLELVIEIRREMLVQNIKSTKDFAVLLGYHKRSVQRALSGRYYEGAENIIRDAAKFLKIGL
jgi:D-aminopeptidase